MAQTGSNQLGDRPRLDAQSGPQSAQAMGADARDTGLLADASDRLPQHAGMAGLALAIKSKERSVGLFSCA
jgi:hypothetical protein